MCFAVPRIGINKNPRQIPSGGSVRIIRLQVSLTYRCFSFADIDVVNQFGYVGQIYSVKCISVDVAIFRTAQGHLTDINIVDHTRNVSQVAFALRIAVSVTSLTRGKLTATAGFVTGDVNTSIIVVEQ